MHHLLHLRHHRRAQGRAGDAPQPHRGAVGLPVHGICPVTSDCYLSYLPMAHVLERVMQLAMLIGGASVGFYQVAAMGVCED